MKGVASWVGQGPHPCPLPGGGGETGLCLPDKVAAGGCEGGGVLPPGALVPGRRWPRRFVPAEEGSGGGFYLGARCRGGVVAAAVAALQIAEFGKDGVNAHGLAGLDGFEQSDLDQNFFGGSVAEAAFAVA